MEVNLYKFGLLQMSNCLRIYVFKFETLFTFDTRVFFTRISKRSFAL